VPVGAERRASAAPDSGSDGGADAIGRRLPGRAGGYPPGPPTAPDVRNERIRFLGNQRLGRPLAHHCAALHGQSAMVDDLGCGQDGRC